MFYSPILMETQTVFAVFTIYQFERFARLNFVSNCLIYET